MVVTAIAGLPGSGKTSLAERLARERGCVLRDDPRCDDLPKIAETIAEGRDIVIADQALCRQSARDALVKFVRSHDFNAEINWIYFENDPEKALTNDSRRPKERRSTFLIAELSLEYVIPDGASTVPVWEEREG